MANINKALWVVFIFCACLLFFCNNLKSNNSSTAKSSKCVEPENPYSEGGHFAGFNWARETGGNCDGNSESFNEGCEEYYRQLNLYNDCIANKK